VISRERAVELVEAQLARERETNPWRAHGPEVAVFGAEQHALGWLVRWQSVDWIRTRDFRHMLVGGGPYLVDGEDGSIHHIPVTVYGTDGWEDLYREQVRGIPRPEPSDPLLETVSDLVRSDGVMPALRHLRKHAPQLGIAEAQSYVRAVRDGATPPQDLLDRTKPPRTWFPFGIDTLTGPAV
jgi:hypothetical protein